MQFPAALPGARQPDRDKRTHECKTTPQPTRLDNNIDKDRRRFGSERAAQAAGEAAPEAFRSRPALLRHPSLWHRPTDRAIQRECYNGAVRRSEPRARARRWADRIGRGEMRRAMR